MSEPIHETNFARRPSESSRFAKFFGTGAKLAETEHSYRNRHKPVNPP